MRSQLQHQPVGDDLDAGVALERHQRAIDRRERAHAALAAIRASAARAPAARRVGERRGVRAGGEQLDVAQQRRHRAQVRRRAARDRRRRRRRSSPAAPSRRRSAGAGRRCAAACASTRMRDVARLDEIAGARLRARGRCCRRPSPPPRAPRLRCARAATSAAATSSAASGRNRSCGQRERTVGSSTSGRDVTRMKIDAGRRLLERLQQRVLRRRHERVGLVDDHHAAAAFERPVAGAIDRRRAPARS